MILHDCQIVETTDVDEYGHPLNDQGRPLVIQNFLDVGRDQEVHDLHATHASTRQPVMLCGERGCVNADHFHWRDRGFYETEDYKQVCEAFTSGREFRYRETLKKEEMSEVATIKQELHEMTEEQLKEIVSGQRKLRREPDKTTTRKKSAAPKKVPKAEQVQGDLAGLTKEQRLEILKMLGGVTE